MRRLLLILAQLCALALLAQQEWSVRQYTAMDGLPQNSILSLALDDRGYLLLSTEGGLVRYDGLSFRQVPLRPKSFGTGGRTREILRLSSGGLVLRDAGSRVYLIGPDSAVLVSGNRPIIDPYPLLRGGIATVEDLLVISDQVGRKPAGHALGKGQSIIDLGDGSWGIMYLDEILVYKGQERQRVWKVPFEIAGLFEQHGIRYVLGRNGITMVWDPEVGPTGAYTSMGLEALPQGLEVSRLHWRQGDGTVFASAGNKVWRLTPDPVSGTLRWERLALRMSDGVEVLDVLEDDRSGSLFVATDVQGLFQYTKHVFTTVPVGVNGGACYAQALTKDGMLVVDVAGGLHQLDPRSPYTTQERLGRRTTGQTIHIDEEDGIWISLEDSLIRRNPHNAQWELVPGGLGMDMWAVEDLGDTLWLSLRTGLGFLENGVARRAWTSGSRDWTSVATSFTKLKDGRTLLATCSGLYGWRKGGDAEPIEFPGECPRTLAWVGDLLLIGTYGHGTFVYYKDVFRQLPMDDRGLLTHVHAFVPDSAGYLWISSNQGVFRLLMSDLRAWLEDPDQRIHYGRYGDNDGIRNVELNGGCDPVYLILPDGRISFPGMGGLVWFDPYGVPDAYPHAPVRVEQLRIDGLLVGLDSVVQVPSGHEDLDLSISVVYFGDPGNVQLEYALDGRWMPMKVGQRGIVLQRLPAGRHVLEVRKVGGQHRGDHSTVRLVLDVEAPFHRTVWFYLLMAALATLVVWGITMVNAAFLRRRNKQLEEHVRARTLALSRANSELRQAVEARQTLVSVISHDIVSPLRFIARVSGAARVDDDSAELKSRLADISYSSERLYDHAQNLLGWIRHQQGNIQVEPKHVPMHNMVHELFEVLRKKAEHQGVALINDVSHEDVLRTDHDLLRAVLQNLLSNALTHTAEGHVRVHAQETLEHYRLVVEDTGAGIPRAVLDRISAALNQGAYTYRANDRGSGLGLVIVFGLLPLLGATMEVDSELGKGTRIVLELPLALT